MRGSYGYKVVNADIARAVLGAIEGDAEPLVMLHDYHLYTCPALIREARPDVLLHHFVHIPWSQPDSWRILPGRMREEIFRGLLANDIIGFHTTAYCRNFLHCCRELLELEVDYERGAILHSGRETWVRAYPLGIDAGRLERAAASQEVAEYEQELLRRRRDHLILRVDRADLSKNVLRGFTAFDTFLQQHPEFRERVTFIAHLQPSRTDVPEYAEYLDRIEALVAVVNHRHGTTDWMPIDLRIYENFPEAVARYKHFDLLMVNSLFDGMNLVAKEAPAVNTRDGVVLLSENTGAHEELGDCTLSVNPFDIQEQADTDPPGPDHGPGGARPAGAAPARDRPRARPRRLDRGAARRPPGQDARRTRPLRDAPNRSAQSADHGDALHPGPAGLVGVAALLRHQRRETRICGARWSRGSGSGRDRRPGFRCGPGGGRASARLRAPGSVPGVRRPRARQPGLEADPVAVSHGVARPQHEARAGADAQVEMALERGLRVRPVGDADLAAGAGGDPARKRPSASVTGRGRDALGGSVHADAGGDADAGAGDAASTAVEKATGDDRASSRRRRRWARSVAPPEASEIGQRLSTLTRRSAQVRLAAVLGA